MDQIVVAVALKKSDWFDGTIRVFLAGFLANEAADTGLHAYDVVAISALNLNCAIASLWAS